MRKKTILLISELIDSKIAFEKYGYGSHEARQLHRMPEIIEAELNQVNAPSIKEHATPDEKQ